MNHWEMLRGMAQTFDNWSNMEKEVWEIKNSINSPKECVSMRNQVTKIYCNQNKILLILQEIIKYRRK